VRFITRQLHYQIWCRMCVAMMLKVVRYTFFIKFYKYARYLW
jgi:hypothetical protein